MSISHSNELLAREWHLGLLWEYEDYINKIGIEKSEDVRILIAQELIETAELIDDEISGYYLTNSELVHYMFNSTRNKTDDIFYRAYLFFLLIYLFYLMRKYNLFFNNFQSSSGLVYTPEQTSIVDNYSYGFFDLTDDTTDSVLLLDQGSVVIRLLAENYPYEMNSYSEYVIQIFDFMYTSDENLKGILYNLLMDINFQGLEYYSYLLNIGISSLSCLVSALSVLNYSEAKSIQSKIDKSLDFFRNKNDYDLHEAVADIAVDEYVYENKRDPADDEKKLLVKQRLDQLFDSFEDEFSTTSKLSVDCKIGEADE